CYRTHHTIAMKLKLSLPIFFFLFFFLVLTLFSNLATCQEEETDPELQTCKHQCRQQQQYSEEDKRTCMRRCDEYYETKQEREREKEKEKEQEMEEKQTHHHHHHHGKEEEKEEEEEEIPYVFEEEDFDTIHAAEGTIDVLKKFTRKSKLLQGIENFRLSFIKTRSHAFVTPRHFDSEIVLVNVVGRATIGLVMEDKTEKVNLEPGDFLRIPAGTPVYIVNRDWNDLLSLILFHIPVSTPGHFEEFFGLGGRDPESVLTAFSWEVLEAALKTPRQKLEKLFDQQNEGSIFTISGEEVQAMSPKKSFWPFGIQSKTPFNIFSKDPIFSNQYGSLIEVGPSDKKSELEGLNLMITFTKIIKGSMSTILYNSHATKIAVVIDGEGKFEMACPHVSSSHTRSKHQKTSPSYHKISAKLKPATVFVVPAGHPFVTIASKKNDLKIICFEVHAEGNHKLTFAGKNNIVSALDKTAKELAFNYPAEKVDEIFNRNEQFFFPFEEETKENGHADA
ncbi:sucrose-binding protein-like, partial [Abrus precatorius]|uniref:Sucrose-binding protein-like n=1 Tax=Abrus precatorius TaxID=3816 RepID=A0A8B8MLA6_ABRPR